MISVPVLQPVAEELAEDRVRRVVHVGRVGVAADAVVLELVGRARPVTLAGRCRCRGSCRCRRRSRSPARCAAPCRCGHRRTSQPARRAVGLGAAGHDLPRQPGVGPGASMTSRGCRRCAAVMVRVTSRAPAPGSSPQLARDRGGADVRRRAQGLADALPGGAGAPVDDEVATEHGDAGEVRCRRTWVVPSASRMVSVARKACPSVARAATGVLLQGRDRRRSRSPAGGWWPGRSPRPAPRRCRPRAPRRSRDPESCAWSSSRRARSRRAPAARAHPGRARSLQIVARKQRRGNEESPAGSCTARTCRSAQSRSRKRSDRR